MFCCSECFSSSYVKEIINSGERPMGNCDFCDSKGIAKYNPRELGKLFPNIFDLYINNKISGKSIEIQIETDFEGKIFSNKLGKNRKKLLKEIIADDFATYKHLFNEKVQIKKLYQNNHVKPLQISWEKFANEIKATNRFHIQNTLDLTKLKELLNMYEQPLHRGKKYFRARISDGEKGFKKNEMHNPPAGKAKAGRANPQGISYLYLANDIPTTLYEARASLFDYVTVGEFELKENIRVINLREDMVDLVYLAEQGKLEEFLIHLPFIRKLEQELSRARRRSDNELDYLPTQYLSEFIKSIGFDGVEFRSSLNPNGYNLAIFNPDKFVCKKVEVHEIENLSLSHKHLR